MQGLRFLRIEAYCKAYAAATKDEENAADGRFSSAFQKGVGVKVIRNSTSVNHPMTLLRPSSGIQS